MDWPWSHMKMCLKWNFNYEFFPPTWAIAQLRTSAQLIFSSISNPSLGFDPTICARAAHFTTPKRHLGPWNIDESRCRMQIQTRESSRGLRWWFARAFLPLALLNTEIVMHATVTNSLFPVLALPTQARKLSTAVALTRVCALRSTVKSFDLYARRAVNMARTKSSKNPRNLQLFIERDMKINRFAGLSTTAKTTNWLESLLFCRAWWDSKNRGVDGWLVSRSDRRHIEARGGLQGRRWDQE